MWVVERRVWVSVKGGRPTRVTLLNNKPSCCVIYSIFERRDDFNLTPVASLIESTPDKHGCFTH